MLGLGFRDMSIVRVRDKETCEILGLELSEMGNVRVRVLRHGKF